MASLNRNNTLPFKNLEAEQLASIRLIATPMNNFNTPQLRLTNNKFTPNEAIRFHLGPNWLRYI